MKQKTTKLILVLLAALFSGTAISQGGTVPEILYYKFNQTGTTIINEASSPPAGTNTATIVGGQTQGGSGLCQTGLVGTGGSSSIDYVNTGWNTDLGTGSWTIAFWVDSLPNDAILYYQFGDGGAGSFRCFNNGIAGAGNFMLRGPITDVPCTGCAPVGAPSMVTFVYDSIAGNITSYHDGVLNTVVSQAALNISGTDFKVGGYSTSNIGLADGQIMDEFRVYDRALDAQEVFETYNQCLPLSSSPDDAGISSIDGPVNFCAGTEDILATIRNYGTNQIDTVTVNWTINGAPQTPYNHYGLIDTVGGTNPYFTQITLGSYNFTAGVPTVIEAWTSMPNNVVDTVTNNDSTMAIVQPSLAGNFTIGGTSPDYPDFSSAVADLNSYGVCGPVLFDVRSGVYTEQVLLSAINGTSGTNTITFRSEAMHRDSVTLTFESTTLADNYTVKFAGADYVTIEQMTIEATGATYGTVLNFGGVSDSNTVWDCGIIGTPGTTTSTNKALLYSGNSNDNYNSFIGNTFIGGSYNVYWYGDGSASLEEGTLFENNLFQEAYYQGARLYYQDAPHVINNQLQMNSSYTGTHYGFYMTFCDNAMVFTGNNGYVGPDNYGYGLYFSSCDGSTTEQGLVANNMMSIGNPLSTSTSYGLYSSGNGRVKFFNNSILVRSGGTSSRAFYTTGGGLNELVNNTFVLEGPGYAGYIASNYSLSNSNYNNFYTTGTNLMYFNQNYADLASYQTASGFDMNSISIDPVYQSFDDLHVCSDSLNAMGTPLASVTTDIDGSPRDVATPDIGADEYAPLTGAFLGADDVICTSETLTLWAGAPNDLVVWSTGDTSMWVNVTTPGTYIVDVASACGASASDTIVITQSALDYHNFITADTTFFCTPGSAILTSTQTGTSYDWSTAETTQSITVTASGTYVLNVTDECGSGVDSITVIGASAPVVDFTETTSFVTAFFTNNTVSEGPTTYDWDFGDGASSTQIDPTHVYTAAGTYLVTLTVTNDCGTATFSDSVTLTTVGLEEIGDGNSLSIYPNPNNGSFTLDISLLDNADVKVRVTNELGQAIYTNALGEVTGNSTEMIDLGTVQSGLYFITVIVDDNPYVSKFIVK